MERWSKFDIGNRDILVWLRFRNFLTILHTGNFRIEILRRNVYS